MKDRDNPCDDPRCICHNRNKQWWWQEVHDEENFFEWLALVGESIAVHGAPYKRQGGSSDYTGIMGILWDHICQARGMTSAGPVQARTLEEGAARRSAKAVRDRRPVSQGIRTQVYERDGYACVVCGVRKELTLDHIEPWSEGGSNDIENLQTMCRSCNSRKGAKPWQSAGNP